MAAPHVRDYGAQELRTARGPGQPRRRRQGDERVTGQQGRSVAEAAGERIADDDHEHGGHRGEGEQRGQGRTEDVAQSLEPSGRAALSHRRGRS